ncbi:hypothetical protein EXIGLDRAFT_177217 [Exidia glandulosa HHB12029]|uniref:Uncharacterized protein n=1 Tax=Exidia glandulosa HHB12029 TaxID=1314781 RepID=A0A165N417_EXIGL|nr:hypothetical protein EXIGLDRAFT_177217 [Exidia glandulosa HHB12029]
MQDAMHAMHASRAPSTVGSRTPATMRTRELAEKRGTPRSHLHAQIMGGGIHDVSPIVPELAFNTPLVGPRQSEWDGESRFGAAQTPRNLMQPTVADASPSPMRMGPASPVRSGAILEQRTGQPVAGPSNTGAGFSPIQFSVQPPGHQQQEDWDWDADGHSLLAPPPPPGGEGAGGSGWDHGGGAGGSGWDGGGGSGWPDFGADPNAPLSWEHQDGPPPLGHAPSQGGSDASLYAVPRPHPSRPPSTHSRAGSVGGLRPPSEAALRPSAANSRAGSTHSASPSALRPPSRTGSQQGSRHGSTHSHSNSPRRSPLAPPSEHPFSPSLSQLHGADMYHTAVGPPPLGTFAPSPPPLGSPQPHLQSAVVSHQPSPSASRLQPSPSRSPTRPSPANSRPSRPGTARLGAPTPIIARDYALPSHARVVNIDSSGTPRFLPVVPPPGVPPAASALRDVLVAVDSTSTGPRHPDAASMASRAMDPLPEPPAPVEEEVQVDAPGPSTGGGGGFLGRMGSLFGGGKKGGGSSVAKPPGPRKVKKKKGRGAVEEALGEELGDAPPPPPDDGEAQRERERREAEDEAMRVEAEEARRIVLEEALAREREEEAGRDEEAARARAEAVDEAHSALHAHPEPPPPAEPEHEVEADTGGGGGGKKGWFGLGRKLTKKRKGTKEAPREPSPPKTTPSPFVLPPNPQDEADRASERTLTDAGDAHGGTTHAPTLLDFTGPPGSEEREFVVVPSPTNSQRGGQGYGYRDPHSAISVHVPTPPRGGHAHTQGLGYPASQMGYPGPATNYAPSRAGFTTTGQTPRLPSTYQMPFANARRPGPPAHTHTQPPHVRTVSGGSGALAFQLPSQHLSVPPNGHARTSSEPNVPQTRQSPLRYASLPAVPAPGPPFDPSEHQRVMALLDGAEALRERAFLNNEERRARLFDEAEDRRRQEAEARRRIIEVWV